MPSSFGPLVLIANPEEAGGRVGRELTTIEHTLTQMDLRYRVHRASQPADATRAARAALGAGERFLVAVGGDAMVHDVVNGMFQDDQALNPNAVLGLIAGGAECDFMKTFGLPEDAVRACRFLEGPNVYQVDVGKVTLNDDQARSLTRYFANVAEAGLGAAVLQRR